ncbi:dihydrofolate reductase family protein [Niabella beijingensis]|uniref:dihydrofolate reductase family protein n=1 Tax=Niabella beijingensis TaxID=2872700 RepID=UPI001CBF17E5|nr:dihydrofolate reductase family protein [Niabella beijingensis]MBZ4190396.1 dihydrofolate reductase family protein [Niabella beijingensis]
MSRIFVFNWISVDGIFSGPDGATDWFTHDAELDQANREILDSADTILFGRVTFKMMESFWPTAGAAEQFPDVARYMSRAAKHTFSTTVTGSTWENSFFYKEISPESIAAIRKTAGNDIVVFGSGMVCNTLLRNGWIDTYTLLLDPQLMGRGRRFFTDVPPTALRLKETRTFPSGIVRLDYDVV